jgi:hypothetical protein
MIGDKFGGTEVTLVIISNDGNEARALCKENNDVVVFTRGAQSKNQFMEDLAVGRENKSRFHPTPDRKTARLLADRLRRSLDNNKGDA